jgi:hypothetical protein
MVVAGPNGPPTLSSVRRAHGPVGAGGCGADEILDFGTEGALSIRDSLGAVGGAFSSALGALGAAGGGAASCALGAVGMLLTAGGEGTGAFAGVGGARFSGDAFHTFDVGPLYGWDLNDRDPKAGTCGADGGGEEARDP